MAFAEPVDRRPLPEDPPQMYAQRLKYIRRDNTKLNRNNLEVIMERDEGVTVNLDSNLMLNILVEVGVENGLET